MSNFKPPDRKRVRIKKNKFNEDKYVFEGGTRKVKTYKVRVHADVNIEASNKDVSINLQIDIN